MDAYDPDVVTVSADGLTVHDLLFKRDRGATSETIAETYRLNPGLADLGPHLPAGTRLRLAPAPDPDEVVFADVVDLWSREPGR